MPSRRARPGCRRRGVCGRGCAARHGGGAGGRGASAPRRGGTLPKGFPGLPTARHRLGGRAPPVFDGHRYTPVRCRDVRPRPAQRCVARAPRPLPGRPPAGVRPAGRAGVALPRDARRLPARGGRVAAAGARGRGAARGRCAFGRRPHPLLPPLRHAPGREGGGGAERGQVPRRLRAARLRGGGGGRARHRRLLRHPRQLPLPARARGQP